MKNLRISVISSETPIPVDFLANFLSFAYPNQPSPSLLTQKSFIDDIRRRIAQVSVDAPALRGQGPPGTLEIARNFLEEEIDLQDFASSLKGSKAFSDFLDDHTGKLRKKFKGEAKENFGAARKAINLYLRDVVYNTYLVNHLKLPVTEREQNTLVRHLEVPLDNFVAKGLESTPGTKLKGWTTIKALSPAISQLYQDKAREYAEQKDMPRVHLDLEFWRSKK